MSDLLTEEIREPMSLFDVEIDVDAEMQIEEVRMPTSLFDNESEQGDSDMQTLGLCDEPDSEKRKGFWRRQFQAEPTRRQKQYDWFFGVIMPLVCIFFDPIVFKMWCGDRGGGIFGAYRPFAYS